MRIEAAQYSAPRWMSVGIALIIAAMVVSVCGALRGAGTLDAVHYNEDGFLELAIPNENDKTATALFNNGDGYSDVAAMNTDSATVSVLLNLGDGALGPPIDFEDRPGVGPDDLSVTW